MAPKTFLLAEGWTKLEFLDERHSKIIFQNRNIAMTFYDIWNNVNTSRHHDRPPDPGSSDRVRCLRIVCIFVSLRRQRKGLEPHLNRYGGEPNRMRESTAPGKRCCKKRTPFVHLLEGGGYFWTSTGCGIWNSKSILPKTLQGLSISSLGYKGWMSRDS